MSNITIIEALRDSLTAAGRYNPDDVVRPAAIIWTDADRQWQPVISQLQILMPELLVLGEYQPGKKTGPAIWLRCVIDRALPEVDIPEEAVPVIYMPGVSRQTLRAVYECPDGLKPLVELQYRGVCWTHKNGKDWTVEAFLVSRDGGLGLDLAKDGVTRAALVTALPELIVRPVSQMQGRHLEAEDFEKLIIEDPVKDLLRWLNKTEEVRLQWPTAKWKTFRSRCKKEYKFDPEKDGELVAGERLGRKVEGLVPVWERFTEAPALYPGVAEVLRKAKPINLGMWDDKSTWPQENEGGEELLRTALLHLEGLPGDQARAKILELEKAHGDRREWVWARLGKAPLAKALRYLAILAQPTGQGLGGTSPEAMAELYVSEGWQADDAALSAMAEAVSGADSHAVQAALRSCYLPWLESSALHFQELIEKKPLPNHEAAEKLSVGNGCVIVFADGLRWDTACRLLEKLKVQGWQVQLSSRWAALPTVTATAKPAVSPVAGQIGGNAVEDTFQPLITKTEKNLTVDRFRKLLAENKVQYLAADETGDPAGQAWTEQGELDSLGHSLQAKLASRINEQLDLLLERLQTLFNAGWKEILVVTDHGWLLMPGGLLVVALPKYLTESRWSRCAAIKEGARVDCPVVPWHWNPHHYVAVGPGVACFGKGNEYAHGGLSLQECLVPVISIQGGGKQGDVLAAIAEVKWTGLRCRVKVENGDQHMKVDIRMKVNEPDPEKVKAKALGKEGEASLFIIDDSLEGTPAVVVLVDATGNVIAKQATIIGGEE
ncbi:MAG: BREX-1 system phosphatase PglZ type B [Desulfobulbaceae bacterium]|nr:BREX-1 system phosphatase PglZ type B [Desulfobulbaceae bacterium]